MSQVRPRVPTASALQLADLAWRAGEIVLRHYAADAVQARAKQDHSPVTDADAETETFILAELHKQSPGIPVIAEEEAAAGRVCEIGAHFFLVDPLDGTREFLNRNGEFTVNIGEIVNGSPVRGVVFAPAIGRLFVGEESSGTFELATGPAVAPDFDRLRPISARRAPPDGLIAVASRSHRDSRTDEYLAGYQVRKFVSAGSSLKFCLLASGEADIYPRLGRTMEWDTAAGHAILAAAGGTVATLDGSPLVYGKTDKEFANPFFVARGRV